MTTFLLPKRLDRGPRPGRKLSQELTTQNIGYMWWAEGT